jgi:hypothetical protein
MTPTLVYPSGERIPDVEVIEDRGDKVAVRVTDDGNRPPYVNVVRRDRGYWLDDYHPEPEIALPQERGRA